MRIALAQINPHVGDLAGNVERCLGAVREARRSEADLVVLPEMALPGCPPLDMLLDESFVTATIEATRDLATRASGGPPVLVGTIERANSRTPRHPSLHNVAVLLDGGEIRARVPKQRLPIHDVHLDPRWFLTGGPRPPNTVGKRKIEVRVGDDFWDATQPSLESTAADATAAPLLMVPSASHYERGILARRHDQARRMGRLVAYVNLVGGQDGLIYDGRSFAMNARGEVVGQLRAFEEEVRVCDIESARPARTDLLEPIEELFRALVLGVRDFARKNRLRRAVVGVSGGIDSSVVCAIAAEALGSDNVTSVAIPSRHTDSRSTDAARALSKTLGTRHEVVPLHDLHASAERSLAAFLTRGTSAENVQARLRMTVLMAVVNNNGGFLLNTSNKTELAFGYGTLYGDLAGALYVLGDVHKPDVYALARFINREREVIPRFAVDRPPSAELHPEQVDPFDYAKVAPEIEALLRVHRSDATLRRSEHKRRQAGVVLKVSATSFGFGRIVPVTRL